MTTRPADAENQQQFDAEWFKAVRQFGIVAGFNSFTFTLRHPETNNPIQPCEGLGETFDDWKQIQSPWDRQRLLFGLIFDGVNKSMNHWQIANIMTANRQPDQALHILESNSQPVPGSDDYARHCAAYAKAFLGLQQPEKAICWAELAAQTDPESAHFRTVLADALNLSGDCEKSDQIYAQLMRAAPASGSGASDPIADMFGKLFSCETGSVSSPVFAIQIAKSLGNQEQAEEFLRLAETEFYSSPYFRIQHAYYLANHGEWARCIAKLAALVQEMPGLREPTINLLIMLDHFSQPGKQIMPELREQLQHAISANGWTTEGMEKIQVGTDMSSSVGA